MVAETHSIQTACRVLDVAESTFYDARTRVPSNRAIRHAWLTDMIIQVHTASRGTYGSRRVHAELTMGYGVGVGREAVAFLCGVPNSRVCPVIGVAARPIRRRRPRTWSSGTSHEPLRTSCG